jgi:ribosome biogenesis GTPase A
MCLCSKNRNAGKLLASKINEIKKQYSFNVRHEVLRGLVAGVPNVGKSTLINQLGGGKKQNAENKPGVTRDVKIIPVSDNFEILDSPGLLWPKIEDQNNAVKLALLGCIKDEILDAPELAAKSLLIFLSKYPVLYEKRYGIKIEIPHDTEEAVDYVHSIIDSTAKKRGCILQGGITDIEKASKLIIKEIREGVLGCISLESPEDLEKILD